MLHKRSKHIHIVYHVVRREVNRKHVRLNYIHTSANLADLLTKGLKEATHLRLAKELIAIAEDGKLKDFSSGKEIPLVPREAVRETLYTHEPLGLMSPDVLLPKVRCIEDYDRFSDGELRGLEMRRNEERTLKQKEGRSDVRGGRETIANSNQLRGTALIPAAAAVTQAAAQVTTDLAFQVAWHVAKDIAGQVMEHIVEKRRLPQTWVDRWTEQLGNAIIDSGASYTYVPETVDLMSASPGGGHVIVANGQREAVKECGWLGPLRARKVGSFERPLISVRDLVDALGEIRFTRNGVVAHTVTKGGPVSSMIGGLADSRLYSFDMAETVEHVRRVTHAAAVGVR